MIKSSEINDYFVPSLLDATNVMELWESFTDIMFEFKFSRIIYATTKISKLGLSENLKDGLVLSNHNSDYIEKLIENKCFDNDTNWMKINRSDCVSWNLSGRSFDKHKDNLSEVLFYPPIKKLPSKYEKNVRKLCKEYNIKAGYTLFFKHHIGTGSSGLSLCANPGMMEAETNTNWKVNGHNIRYLSKLFDVKARELPYIHFSLLPIRKKLTKRQKESLYWVSKGKAIHDISTIMKLSIPTIDKHLRLARRNLNAKTTIQAVVKAQENEQLYNFTYF